MNNQPYLTCSYVIHRGFSKDIFFEWIQRINCIESIQGKGTDFYLYLTSANLTTSDIYELLAFFRRFRVDLKQLKSFLNKENKELFLKDEKAFWHQALFTDFDQENIKSRKKAKKATSLKSNYLMAANMKYYSLIDEQLFFEWAQKIECIKQCYVSEQTVYIELKSHKLSKKDLYDLLAFLKHYEIDMKQLLPLVTKRNQSLLDTDYCSHSVYPHDSPIIRKS